MTKRTSESDSKVDLNEALEKVNFDSLDKHLISSQNKLDTVLASEVTSNYLLSINSRKDRGLLSVQISLI